MIETRCKVGEASSVVRLMPVPPVVSICVAKRFVLLVQISIEDRTIVRISKYILVFVSMRCDISDNP